MGIQLLVQFPRVKSKLCSYRLKFYVRLPFFCKKNHPRKTTEHKRIFIFKYLFYLYLHSLTANFRSFIRMSSLFCVDDVMTKAQNSVKISYFWEECPYWEFGSLTGIPPHIVTYVNQEKIIKKIDDGFTCFTTMMQGDLDQRQIGGGNLSIEIMQEHIIQPIKYKMDSLEIFIQTRVKGANNTEISGGIIKVTSDNFYHWSTTGNIPHLLPEDFALDASILPLTLWHCWHRGLTDVNGRVIDPLKYIPCRDYPIKKNQRIFTRMKHFCCAIDGKLQVNGEESIANLPTSFNAGIEMLTAEGILLSKITSTGRKLMRQS